MRPEGTTMALRKVREVAEELGTTERHVRNLIYLHGLPYVKVGQSVRIDPRDLEAWLASRRMVR